MNARFLPAPGSDLRMGRFFSFLHSPCYFPQPVWRTRSIEGLRSEMVPQMQQMQKMQAKMERIHESENPAQRRRLMRECTQSTHESVKMMHRSTDEGRMRQCRRDHADSRIDQMQIQKRALSARMRIMDRQVIDRDHDKVTTTTAEQTPGNTRASEQIKSQASLA